MPLTLYSLMQKYRRAHVKKKMQYFVYRKVTVLPVFSHRQRRAADLETLLCWAICILTGTLGTFSISSFLFQFVITENNFNVVSRKMVNARTLQWKYRPHFELSKNSAHYSNRHHTMAAEVMRFLCATENPDWTEKQMNLKTVFFF